MSELGQKTTREAYEDPDIVEGYIKEHSLNPKLPRIMLNQFAQSLPGNKILDVGCGPGHDSYIFAEMGCEVIGIDYSNQMIQAAKNFKKPANNAPRFIQTDIEYLDKEFKQCQFDGVWACASLVHVPTENISTALSQLYFVLREGGKGYIGVKGGTQQEQIIEEDKYGPVMRREFTFWQPEVFSRALLAANFTIDKYTDDEVSNRQRDGKTFWLNYWVSKL